MTDSYRLTYDGVELRQVRTLKFEERCLYDPESAGLAERRITLAVEGLVHLQDDAPVGWLPPSSTDSSIDDVGAASAALRRRLMQPGGELFYGVGDVVLLQARGSATGEGEATPRDLRGGPRPLSLTLAPVAGASLLRATWEVEISLAGDFDREEEDEVPEDPDDPEDPGDPEDPDDPGDDDPREEILLHTWSLEEVRDERFYAIRTWRGSLRLRDRARAAHAMRALTLPPQLPYFRRERMEFLAAPDGLSLAYVVRDRQFHAAPPSPAVDWEAHYEERAGENAFLGEASLRVKLFGGPRSRPSDLAIACVQVAYARLGDLRPGAGLAGNGVLRDARLRQDLHDNVVELEVTVLRTSLAPRAMNLRTTAIHAFEGWEGYDPRIARAAEPFDEASLLGAFSAWLAPTEPERQAMPDVQELDPVEGPDRAEVEPPTILHWEATGEMPLDSPTLYRLDHLEAPYTLMQQERRYRIDHGRLPIPLSQAIDGVSCVVVTRHPPVAERELLVRAERVGAWPEIPRAEDQTDANGIVETLLEERITPHLPKLLPDGGRLLYRVEARYRYALSRAPGPAELLRAGSLPALDPAVVIAPYARASQAGEG